MGEPALMARWLLIPLALLLDVLLGDPPNRWHPVAWMGSQIGWLRRRAPNSGNRAQFVYGAGVAVGGAAVWGGIGALATRLMRSLPKPLARFLEVAALKSALSLKGLERAGRAVETPLAAGNLEDARKQISWHLVSRDTSELTEAQVAAATIESLAENASDSVLAPLFWYGVAGLPGALAYRYLNTCDAMLGYRDAEREWLGKASARLDDAANLIPARLTALAIVASTPLVGGHVGAAWRIWRRDARKTVSPNAGHPMAAAAGALGVELDKVGVYRLGAEGREAGDQDISRMIALLRTASVVGAMALMALAWISRKRTIPHEWRTTDRRTGSF